MRCKCCDSIFHPAIITNELGDFVKFEDFCQVCDEAANADITVFDVFKDDDSDLLAYIIK